jgi:3-oxoacyl-[acyl-carrier-protein] synthase II
MKQGREAMKRRVVVTGLGVVAPNGNGRDDFWHAITEGVSGVVLLDHIDIRAIRAKVGAPVKNLDPLRFMPSQVASRVDRFVHLGMAAAAMAIEDSCLELERMDRERTGVIMGSGLGGILFHEEQLMRHIADGLQRAHPTCVPKIAPNAVSAHIAIRYGLLGPNFVVTTACASGNHAIGEAYAKIQEGRADIILAGGAEAPLTYCTFSAFASLRVLSTADRPPAEASRPFEKNRDGFVLGEGAAVLVLEEREGAIRRGAPILAEITGYGLTSGAYHMVMPAPGGEDAARAMKLALDDAGLEPRDIDHINAHGTATRANDIAETKAIKSVFGDRAYQIPITATKSTIGHTIGAAGAIEAVVACLTLEKEVLPPTANHEEVDPECDLDYIPNLARNARVHTILSNSFGFGSVNACLVFQRHSR